MRDGIRSKLAGWLALVSASGLCLTGCEVGHGCTAVYVHSGAALTLHLPPEADVAAPETATACRLPDCVTATIPPIAPPGELATVTFSSADVRGILGVNAGGVRLLQIDWTVPDVNPADPHNDYSVDVKDSAGKTTGRLDGEITYVESMPNGDGCGVVWTGSLSD